MFETSVVKSHALAVQRRASLVSISLAAHAAAVIGVVALGIASVDFPTSVPRQMTMFQVINPPPPLGDPNGGAKPKPKTPEPQQQKQATPPPITQITAPRDTPSTIQPVAESTQPVTDGDFDPNATSTEPKGEKWGDPNSTFPSTQQPVVSVPSAPPILQPGIGDVKPARVLSRIEPQYPNIMRTMRMSATVVIHCIVDKNGRVVDPRITVSSYPPFNDAVLQALERWTFAPGTLHGQPVDTYFNLTVRFQVK